MVSGLPRDEDDDVDPIVDGWTKRLLFERKSIHFEELYIKDIKDREVADNRDASNVDASNVDTINVDASNVDAINVDASNVDASNTVHTEDAIVKAISELKETMDNGFADIMTRLAGLEGRVKCLEDVNEERRQMSIDQWDRSGDDWLNDYRKAPSVVVLEPETVLAPDTTPETVLAPDTTPETVLAPETIPTIVGKSSDEGQESEEEEGEECEEEEGEEEEGEEGEGNVKVKKGRNKKRTFSDLRKPPFSPHETRFGKRSRQ